MKTIPACCHGFYMSDLFVEYTKYDNMQLESLKKSKKGFYQLVYIISGDYIITSNNNKFEVSGGALIISGPEDGFDFWRKSYDAERLEIYFHKSVFNMFLEFNILKIFSLLPSGSCIYPENFDSKICYEALKSFVPSLESRLNRFYIMTKIQTVISELTLNCSDEHIKKSDENNISVAVMEFVTVNFSENITYQTIKDKFFICDSTINKIFHTMTGLSMKEFLTDFRLKNAKSLFDDRHNYLSLKEIAELSGFRTYSTFYREYVKRYGTSPTSAGFHRHKSHFPTV